MPSQRRPPVPARWTCGGAHVPGRRGPSATGRGRGAPSAPGPCALQSDGRFLWPQSRGAGPHGPATSPAKARAAVTTLPCPLSRRWHFLWRDLRVPSRWQASPRSARGVLPAAPAHSASRHPRGLASSESGRLCRVAGRALLGAHAETPARLPGSLLPHVLSLCSGVWRGGSCGHDDPHPHLMPTTASPEARRVPDRLGLGARAGRGQGAARHSWTRDAARLLSSSRPLCGRAEPQDSPAEAPGRPRLECTLPNPWLLKNCLSSLLLSR